MACGNGLGHVRRVIAILDELFRNFDGLRTILLAPLGHIETLRHWPLLQRLLSRNSVNIIDFDSGFADNWMKDEGSLSRILGAQRAVIMKADLIWSDNIHQVLELRPDAVLSGSFFWHEVLEAAYPGNPGAVAYAERSRELIMRCSPVMIGQKDFATSDVRELARYQGVGFYRYGKRQGISHKKYGLLLSCGLSGQCQAEMYDALNFLMNTQIPEDITVWVEPRLFPNKPAPYMLPALFDDHMFSTLVAACSRPGIGTICDVVLSGAKLFAFHEGSFEMKHNSRVLSDMGLGCEAEGVIESLKMALQYIRDPKAIEKQVSKAACLKADGVQASADIIINLLMGGR